MKSLRSRFSWHAVLHNVLPPAILSFFTYLIYYASFNYPFQFDDIPNISKRFTVRGDDALSRWWYHSRWFVDWLNNLNFRIGRFEPFYYRVINVTIHVLAGLCVFYLIKTLCKQLKEGSFLRDHASLISFTSAALFLLHPVQTQTVSYVIQARLEGIASLLILLTLLTYVKGMIAKNTWVKGIYGALFVVCTFASFGTKELVIVLPMLMLLIDWVFLAQGNWGVFKQRLYMYMGVGIFFALLVVNYIGFARVKEILSFSGGQMNNLGNILTPNHFDLITPWSYFISEFRVVLHYLMIFLFPVGISVEYDWKLAPSFFTMQVILPFIVLAAIWYGIVYALQNKKYPMVTFGLLWFFICVSPRSTLIPCAELVCDYKAYLAGLGILFPLAIGMVYGLNKAWESLKNAPSWLHRYEFRFATLSILMLAVGGTAFLRNKVWETSVGFWQDNAAKAPKKARIFNNMGVALCEAGRPEEAVASFKHAIELDHLYADPYSNMSVAHSMLGQTDDAINALKAAIRLAPNYPEAYNNLGTLLIDRKRYDEAKQSLSLAIQIRPHYGKAYYNLARMYEELGDRQMAWQHLKNATLGDFDVPEMFIKLGHLSLTLNKYDEAIKAYERVLSSGPQDDQVVFNLGNAYYMSGNHDAAQRLYEHLIKKDPLDGRYAYNLGEVYFVKKDFKSACEAFKKAAEVQKPVPQGFFRVSNCLEAMNKFNEARTYLNSLFSSNLDNNFKRLVHTELARLDLQQKVTEGKGSVKFNDLKQALGNIQKSVKKAKA